MTKQGDDGRAPSDVTSGGVAPSKVAPGDAAPDDAAPDDAAPDDAAPGDAAPGPAGGGAARVHPRDPLHGITLQTVLEELHTRFGWAELGRRIPIRCFTHEPSMGSSLAFLRRQPWARSQVEDLYLRAKRRRR